MTADGTKLADGADMASEEFCAKSGCHDMDDVVASTWGFEGNGEQFNPHSSHQDLALECGDCHKAHEKSVLMCNQCHKLNMPRDGRPRMQHNGLDRRTFLKGAGITAIGAAAMGALTGCGNGYTVPAGEEPVNASAGQVPGHAQLVGPGSRGRRARHHRDHRHRGAGRGLPHRRPARPSSPPPRTVRRCSASTAPPTVLAPREDIGAIDSKLQLASFNEYPQFKIDKMEAMEDIVRYANGFINYDLVKVWANESGALIDWLTEIVERDGRLVMQFEGSVGTEGQGARDKAWATGHSPNKTDKGKEDKNFNFGVSLKEYAEEKGAEFRWSTELIKLEQDESGRVVGIIAAT